MILIRIILIPVSLIYAAVIYVRNKFYDTGIFKSYKVARPVISVGNITTGGTGKTPFVICISKYFLDKGKKVGIVSRGYKRESGEMILVSDGIGINNSIQESGDELILIADELIKENEGNFFIAAGSDRVSSAEYLIKNFSPDVIILDDGYQHRRIKRDLDIVLIDSNNFLKEKFLNTFTLLSGNLRENFSNMKRADLIIQNNKNDDIETLPDLKVFLKPVILMRYKTEYFMDNKNSILNDSDKNAIVFSGIADDTSFIGMLRSGGISVSETLKFPDHHNYSESDINSLKNIYTKDLVFITTEKDFIKIKQFSEFINNYPVYYLKLSVELGDNRDILFSKFNNVVK